MPRSVIYAIAAVVAVLAIGALVLYGTGDDTVHGMPTPPAVLDKLVLTPQPTYARRGERRAEGRRGPQTPEEREQRRAERRAQRQGGEPGAQPGAQANGRPGMRAGGRPEARAGIQASWEDANGKQVRLADYRGRFVVLNLWATWCGPCITELPALARAQAALARDNVVVIAVDLEKQDAATIGTFLKAHGAESLPVNIDRDLSMMRTFAAYGLPLTILFDKNGREVARASGPQKWDDPQAVAYLREVSNVELDQRREGRGVRGGMRGVGGLMRLFRMFGHGH